MKWHDHAMLWKAMAHRLGYKGNVTEVVPHLLQRRLFGDHQMQNTAQQIIAERLWTEAGRPYYDLYPSVAEAFTNVDLGRITFAQLQLPLPQLLVRMQVGHELQASPNTKVRSVLISDHDSRTGRGWIVAIDTGDQEESIPVHTVTGILVKPEESIADRLREGREHPYCDDVIDNEAVDNVLRIIVALCLLKDDPELIEPQPLATDIDRWNATHDLALIAKAARRGKRGWSVGRHIEVAPGFRRPHFAIRWCGKGRTDPRLRPIRGCLVHRRRIEEVPTDWLGAEQEVG